MRYEDFIPIMLRMTAWFNRKLSSDQLEQWHDKINFMPETAFSEICDDIKDIEKFFPTPSVVKKLYGSWRQSHPGFFIREYSQDDCQECGGVGYHRAWRIPKDMKGFILNGVPQENWNRIDLPCSACENWKNAFPGGKNRPKQLWSKNAILSKGMRLDDPYCGLKGNREFNNNMNSMADSVGKEM